MTELTKPVRRKTRWPYAVLYAGEARAIVVSLEPGDVITFRESGRRQVWTLPLNGCSARRSVIPPFPPDPVGANDLTHRGLAPFFRREQADSSCLSPNRV